MGEGFACTWSFKSSTSNTNTNSKKHQKKKRRVEGSKKLKKISFLGPEWASVYSLLVTDVVNPSTLSPVRTVRIILALSVK